MKIRLLLILSLITTFCFQALPSDAAWVSYQSSPRDSYNSSDLPAAYDAINVDMAISDSSPNEIFFFLNFTNPVFNNQFADGKGSWAAIMLDINNDGKVDFSMETNSQSYVNNFYHTAGFINRQGVVPVSDSRCMAISWSDLINDAKWIGFRIQKTCLNFAPIFGVQAYVDYNSNDKGTSDWAPDDYWQVSLSGAVIPTPKPTPTPTTTSNTNQIAIDAKNAAMSAKIAAQDGFDAFTSSKENCQSISSTFEEELSQELYDATDLSTYCDQLDLEATSLQRKIDALDPETVRTTEAANKEIDDANKLAQAADVLIAKIQDLTDELASTETHFDNLVATIDLFNDFESNSTEQIENLKERIGILPSALQATLKKTNEYKALLAFQQQSQKIKKSKDAILDLFSGIKRPTQITPSINSINSLKVQLPSLTDLKKNVAAIEKKIPATVCQKGSLVVSASKTGKCAKGFESIPTR